MVIFHTYVSLPEGKLCQLYHKLRLKFNHVQWDKLGGATVASQKNLNIVGE